MKHPQSDADTLVAALAESAQSATSQGPIPEPEELLDYLAGRLEPEAERRIQEQLLADPEAARALLDLADFAAAEATVGERPSEVAARSGWRDFEARLSTSQRRRLPASFWLKGMAASLLVATVGLGGWVNRLKNELGLPVANLISVELVAGQRAASGTVVTLPVGAPLRLVISPRERCGAYELELVEPGGGRARSVSGLKFDERGTVTILLRRVEAGHYQVRLFGCDPRREVGSHRFEVARPQPEAVDG